MATTTTFTGASAVPFNPDTQTFGSTPTATNQYSMGTANIGVSTPVQPQLNPITPINIPQSQNIATFGTQPIKLPAQQLPTLSTPVINQADRIIQQTTTPESDLQKQRNTISQTMLDILPQLQGKTQEKYNTVQAATSGIQQRITDLSGQIFQKNAEIQKDDIQLAADLDKLEGGGILKSIVNTQQYDVSKKAQITRSLKMADANMMNAQVLALNGQLEFAKQTAEDAVNAKYSVFEDILNTQKAQLEVLNPLLTSEEKKQAREQDIKTNLMLKELENQKKNEDESRKMLVTAISQGVPTSLSSKAQEIINKGGKPDEVAQALGAYAGDYWGTKLKIAQYQKALGEISDNSSAATTPGKSVAQSWLDQYNSGAMELNDIYTKIGTGKEASRIKNEFAKLVSQQGGKRVIPMDDTQIAAIDDQIKNIDDLLGTSGYNYKVISGKTQGGFLGVGGRITGAKEDALAIAENLVRNQTLQSLADAKAKGVTFGALSEGELNTVAGAASRLAAKAIIDKDTNKITGFRGSESEFKKDLETVKNGLVKAKERKTGLKVFGDTAAQKADVADKILNSPDTDGGTAGYTFGE